MREITMAPRDLAKLQDAHVEMDTDRTHDSDPIKDRHLLLSVQELDVRAQMVFLVRSLGSGSWTDIGKVLGLSETSVKQIFRDARIKLSKLMS